MVSEEQAEDEANDHLDVSNVESGLGHMDHSAQNFELVIVWIPKGIDTEVVGDSDTVLVPGWRDQRTTGFDHHF